MKEEFEMEENQDYYNADASSVEQETPHDLDVVGEKKGFAIASLVLGIVSLVLGCCAYGLTTISSIVGLVLGIIFLKKNQHLGKYQGKGMAIAGIICSAIGLLFGIGMIIYIVYVVSNPEFMDMYFDMLEQYQ